MSGFRGPVCWNGVNHEGETSSSQGLVIRTLDRFGRSNSDRPGQGFFSSRKSFNPNDLAFKTVEDGPSGERSFAKLAHGSLGHKRPVASFLVNLDILEDIIILSAMFEAGALKT